MGEKTMKQPDPAAGLPREPIDLLIDPLKRVITSYSIHYTKLYDEEPEEREALRKRRERAPAERGRMA